MVLNLHGCSCMHSLSMVRNTIKYFNDCKSTVNIGVIDLKKAFDKTNIYNLLHKLLLHKVNISIVSVLENWFCNCSAKVTWNNSQSNRQPLLCGVRQGGVLSPWLFSLYVDCVLDKLEQSGIGCFVNHVCFNSFMYADDLILLSPSVTGLQEMLNICEREFLELDLPINVNKSCTMRVGPRFDVWCKNLNLCGSIIDWTKQIKYLGITIVSSKSFTVSFKDQKSKYFNAANAIFAKLLNDKMNINVTLELIKTNCFPILTYGLCALKLNPADINSLSFAYNCIMCKLFKVKSIKNINECQYFCGLLPLNLLYDYYRYSFLSKYFADNECKFNYAIDLNDFVEYQSLQQKYNLSSNDSKNKVLTAIWCVFTKSMNG